MESDRKFSPFYLLYPKRNVKGVKICDRIQVDIGMKPEQEPYSQGIKAISRILVV